MWSLLNPIIPGVYLLIVIDVFQEFLQHIIKSSVINLEFFPAFSTSMCLLVSSMAVPDMRKDRDAQTLSAEILMECGNWIVRTKNFLNPSSKMFLTLMTTFLPLATSILSHTKPLIINRCFTW